MLFQITILDIIDILLVAMIFYQLYRLLKGTTAFSIFLGIFFVYLFWLVVRALKMELISSILGQVIGVGVIAMIIVFQQEIRKFLLILGNRYMNGPRKPLETLFPGIRNEGEISEDGKEIVNAVFSMSSRMTGALIVFSRKSKLGMFATNGEVLMARIKGSLLETIFFKSTALHDGAVLIENGLIIAARCPLPISEKPDLPVHFGMRHRAAMGITEQTDSYVVVVSEESGKVSLADGGTIRENITRDELEQFLIKENF